MLRIGCVILLWHSLGLSNKYLTEILSVINFSYAGKASECSIKNVTEIGLTHVNVDVLGKNQGGF